MTTFTVRCDRCGGTGGGTPEQQWCEKCGGEGLITFSVPDVPRWKNFVLVGVFIGLLWLAIFLIVPALFRLWSADFLKLIHTVEKWLHF